MRWNLLKLNLTNDSKIKKRKWNFRLQVNLSKFSTSILIKIHIQFHFQLLSITPIYMISSSYSILCTNKTFYSDWELEKSRKLWGSDCKACELWIKGVGGFWKVSGEWAAEIRAIRVPLPWADFYLDKIFTKFEIY